MKIQSIIAIFLICIILISGCVSNAPNENSSASTDAKITVRELANPISDVASFNTIVSSVITDNPFGCTAYMSEAQSHAPVEKVREAYTSRLVFEDANTSIVSTIEYESSTVNGFNTGIAVLMAIAPLAKAQGGICIYNPNEDSYYAMLRCHDPNGEIYYVIFTRDSVVLSNFSNDSIRTRFETWANGLAALAPVSGAVNNQEWWDRKIVLPRLE